MGDSIRRCGRRGGGDPAIFGRRAAGGAPQRVLTKSSGVGVLIQD